MSDTTLESYSSRDLLYPKVKIYDVDTQERSFIDSANSGVNINVKPVTILSNPFLADLAAHPARPMVLSRWVLPALAWSLLGFAGAFVLSVVYANWDVTLLRYPTIILYLVSATAFALALREAKKQIRA
jgi:hypothetical protein